MNGFIKLHRQIKGHWIASRPDWFQAWTFILMSANYETGRVNLTEVYRELADHLDNRAWRYFVEKLAKDGMLEAVEAKNLGDKSGFQQLATITNWSKYHAQTEKDMRHSFDNVSHKSRGALGGAVGDASAERDAVLDGDSEETTRSERGADAERYAESNKNTFQEVNLITPPTPPSENPPRLERPGGEYAPNILQGEYPDVFRQLAKIKSIAGVNTGQFQAWCARVLSDCRGLGAAKVAPLLAELAVNYSSFNLPWKWYGKQVNALSAEQQSRVAPRRPSVPNLAPYDFARTPDGRELEILDITGNGFAVFEDGSSYRVQDLSPVGIAA